MSRITTHILDVSKGCPASGVAVTLERETSAVWEIAGAGVTDADGRVRNLLAPDAVLLTGNYRLTFDTETYFARRQIEGFYPQVIVTFVVRDGAQHFHVPLLLSPFAYSTYRGS